MPTRNFRWKLARSTWLLPVLLGFGLLSWCGFLAIAVISRRWSYWFATVMYVAVPATGLCMIEVAKTDSDPLTGWGVATWMLGWFGSMLHAAIVNPSWLRWYDTKQAQEEYLSRQWAHAGPLPSAHSQHDSLWETPHAEPPSTDAPMSSAWTTAAPHDLAGARQPVSTFIAEDGTTGPAAEKPYQGRHVKRPDTEQQEAPSARRQEAPSARRQEAPQAKQQEAPPRSVAADRTNFGDVRDNQPGAGAFAEAARIQSEHGIGGLQHPRTYSWLLGAQGEVKAAELLAALGSNWVVLHDITISESGANLDHVAIGPTGVFIVNTKNHTGAEVSVREGVVWLGKYPQSYVRRSRSEAKAAAKLLSAAAGMVVPVWGVVLVLNAASVTGPRSSKEVLIATEDDVVRTLSERSTLLKPDEIERILQVAYRPETWLPVSDTQQVALF